MISLLAIMAVPAMKTARDDRMVFDYARQIQALIHRAEVRSMARGAAHLVVIDTGGGSRGTAALFEAVDFTVAPNGPKPVSSCRGQRDNNGAFINHWTEAQAWVPGGAVPVRSPLIDAVNMNGPGVETGMNLFAVLSEQTAGTVPTIVLCYTPGGNVYMGTGGNPTSAITAMRTAAPYTQSLQIELARHDAGGTVLGLRRRVILAGGAAPRIVSQ